MKRWALRIFVLLLLGAIVNVAVAWACAWRIQFADTPASIGRTNLGASIATFAVFEGAGASRLVPMFWNATDAPDYYPDVAPPTWGQSNMKSIDARIALVGSSDAILGTLGEYPVDAAGFPLRCLCCWWENAWALRAGIPLSREQYKWVEQGRSALPLRPTWPGFAINTMFYAAILWMLFAAPFALRRRGRIKRGLCPKCAYNLRGSPPHDASACPECGAVSRAVER